MYISDSETVSDKKLLDSVTEVSDLKTEDEKDSDLNFLFNLICWY